MDGLRDYVLHITATALICAVILRLIPSDNAVKKIMRLLCGIVLAYSIMKPMKVMDFGVVEHWTLELQEDAKQAVKWGKDKTFNALSQSISGGTEAYILEKANAMNADLEVRVELSNDEIPVPISVELVGDVAPYTKTVLSETIANDLGIPKGKQTWISM